jgi:outer membrane biosynthesis protein TonB
VNVEVVIDESGKVVSATAASGHPLLRSSAVKAATNAVFAPVLLRGEPVKVSGVLAYNFQLPDDNEQ